MDENREMEKKLAEEALKEPGAAGDRVAAAKETGAAEAPAGREAGERVVRKVAREERPEEKKKVSPAKLILLFAIVAAVVVIAVILVMKLIPKGPQSGLDYVGQYTSVDDPNATLDIWITDENTFVGMCSWQSSFDQASFIDFTAEFHQGVLVITECKRTDMSYGANDEVVETSIYEAKTGEIRQVSEGNLMITVSGDPEVDKYVFKKEGAY